MKPIVKNLAVAAIIIGFATWLMQKNPEIGQTIIDWAMSKLNIS